MTSNRWPAQKAHASQHLPLQRRASLAAVGLLQQTFGLNLKPLLALGGAGGIAAGFASQQVLQNLVSGG